MFRVGNFAGREGQTFLVSPGPVELTLTSVATWGGPAAPGDEGKRFSLLFHGPVEPLLPERIHRFEHPAMGGFDVFIFPLGPDGAGMRYEAVFA